VSAPTIENPGLGRKDLDFHVSEDLFPKGTATWNARRIHVIYVDCVDAEYSTWYMRWFYVEKWLSGGQIFFHVGLTSTFTVWLVRWISLRRIDVDSTSKSICADMVYFQRLVEVGSTSKSICADMVYFSTLIQRRNFPIHKACWFINVEHTSISRRGFPTVFVDFLTLNTRRFNVDISLSIDLCRFLYVEYMSIPCRGFPTVYVDFSTLNARRFDVEISQSISPVDSSTSNMRRFHFEGHHRGPWGPRWCPFCLPKRLPVVQSEK